MESPSNSDLPAEVIEEILLRLPVKSLLRFKCVCKHWCALIGSPSFVNHHFGHESNKERLLVRHYRPSKDGYAFAVYVDEMHSRYEEPDHLQMPDNNGSTLVGPVNGVFCVVSKSGRMALLNPAMRQFKPLPLLEPDIRSRLFSYDNIFGFGLDPLSGDYKIVTIQCFWIIEMNVANRAIYRPIVFIYSSGSDSWRYFQDVDLAYSGHRVSRSLCNTCTKAVYYWLMYSNVTEYRILAFDMSSEKFKKIQVPDCIKGQDLGLALKGDSIALLSYDSSCKIDMCVDVWVMKNEECWIKSSTFGPFLNMRRPLGFLRNNVLLFETENTLLTLYNVCTQKLRAVEARRKESGISTYWVFSYKESFVSIKGEGDRCKFWDASSDFVKDFFKQ